MQKQPIDRMLTLERYWKRNPWVEVLAIAVLMAAAFGAVLWLRG
jgi:hypothetical protein